MPINATAQVVQIGHSTDQRTGRWRVTPPCCGKPFEPPTTLWGVQRTGCPRCGAALFIDYNDRSVEVDA